VTADMVYFTPIWMFVNIRNQPEQDIETSYFIFIEPCNFEASVHIKPKEGAVFL